MSKNDDFNFCRYLNQCIHVIKAIFTKSIFSGERFTDYTNGINRQLVFFKGHQSNNKIRTIQNRLSDEEINEHK